jgi:hypothetical protein
MFNLACINIHQIYAWQPGFDSNNLTRWIKKGYIKRLRQGYFAIFEHLLFNKTKSSMILLFGEFVNSLAN